MSRYYKTISHHTYAWGFDEPLSEFFFQCFLVAPPDVDADDCVFSISSHITLKPHEKYPAKTDYTNGEILEIIEHAEKEEGCEIVPEQDKVSIMLDMPF